MQVQVNHDNHVHIGEEVSSRLAGVVAGALAHFGDRITSVAMHLGGEHGGDAEKRCMLEARLANYPPVAVTHLAETLQLAIDGALEKLDHALTRRLGRLQTH
jgi:ribosome-associated translation inhibitor RaiA